MKSLPVESFRKKLEVAKDSEGLKIRPRLFQIDRVSNGSRSCQGGDSYRCDSYCLTRVFQNLPAPPKHYGVFDVFADFQSFS